MCTRFTDYFFSFCSSLLAVSFEDFEIHVVDVDMKRVVRIFQGHTNRITDMVSEAPGPHRLKSAFETVVLFEIFKLVKCHSCLKRVTLRYV